MRTHFAVLVLASVFALLLAVPARGLELVVNGGFEQALGNGWQQQVSGSGCMIDRGTGYDPDPDYELFLRKTTGTGSARVHQTVAVPSVDLRFTARAKMTASATATAWSVGAVVLTYLDAYGFELGETRICVKSQYCPWSDGPRTHLISAPSNIWFDYDFIIADELAFLPAIDPGDVGAIRLSAYVAASDC